MKMTTRDLLAKEEGVMTYGAQKPTVPEATTMTAKPGNLKRQQSELKHLQKTISNTKKAQDEVLLTCHDLGISLQFGLNYWTQLISPNLKP